jgi:hypothetical protein
MRVSKVDSKSNSLVFCKSAPRRMSVPATQGQPLSELRNGIFEAFIPHRFLAEVADVEDFTSVILVADCYLMKNLLVRDV